MLAAYAAVVASITALVQLMNFFRDQRKVKISIRHEQEHFEEDGVGGAGEMMTIVIVANAGRRPVTITNVGARHLFPKEGFVNLVCDPRVPLELTEGKQLSALVDEEHIDLSKVEAWEVYDAVGHCYQIKVAALPARIWSRLRSYRRAWKRRRLLRKYNRD